MKDVDKEKILGIVRRRYSEAAKIQNCCGPQTGGSSCCDTTPLTDTTTSRPLPFAYAEQDLQKLPQGAYKGLGCGNPLAVTAVKPGETVLDLGSGGGIDCFLAAAQVGDEGLVIGVDMTPDMLGQARENVRKKGYKNIDFRLGEIENLPVADGFVDTVISNCVINLSPDKPRVYEEIFRVLKPGGRLVVADMVALRPLPEEVRKDAALYTCCLGGASYVEDLREMLEGAGFREIKIEFKNRDLDPAGDPVTKDNIREHVVPAMIEAVKSIG